MNITLKDLKACEKGLAKIMEASLPATSSFRLLGVMNLIRSSLGRLEEVRRQLVIKYGVLDTASGIYSVPKDEDKWDLFMEEMAKVLAEEVHMEGFIPLDINCLGNTAISPMDLEPLMGRFVVDEPKQTTS